MNHFFTSLPAHIYYLPARDWWIGATLWVLLGAGILIYWRLGKRKPLVVPFAPPPKPTLQIVKGDITKLPADVIVNAAKPSLMGGGGVDGAIHAAGGPQILEDCKRLRANRLPNGLGTGEAVVTRAGNLPADWVIHTVGPDRRIGQADPELLRSCYTRSLQAADRMSAESISFPLVSSGVYGWPTRDAVQQALTAFYLAETNVKVIRLVVFDQQTYDIAIGVRKVLGV